MTVYRILYRGSLSSCNYSCGYCPFAKTTNTRDELRRDSAQLQRFEDWVEASDQRLGVFFTPWGEAIIHSYYRQAMIRLSQMPHVERVALQTNLSAGLADFAAADRDALALWATFHPTETSLSDFLGRCRQLDELGVSYSVGVVGLREHFDLIDELRAALPETVYLWINSYKRRQDYYSADELVRLSRVDPYFELNRHYYPSQNKPCLAGETTFTVDGEGNVRRCHFIEQPLGNIYDECAFSLLAPRACTNATCGCHIGYVHRPELQLEQLFGDNLLERIPATWPQVDPRFTVLS